MSRMKTFLKYALWLIGFYILSDILISVGLNSLYRDLKIDGNVDNRISIYQSEATSVNGRIRGTITNSGEEDLSNKFLKLDFYSKRDVFLGRKYIELGKLEKNETINFEAFFKLKDVAYYKTKFVQKKEPEEEIEYIFKDYTRQEIWIMVFLTKLLLY